MISAISSFNQNCNSKTSFAGKDPQTAVKHVKTVAQKFQKAVTQKPTLTEAEKSAIKSQETYMRDVFART